jgi:hypothetical protein
MAEVIHENPSLMYGYPTYRVKSPKEPSLVHNDNDAEMEEKEVATTMEEARFNLSNYPVKLDKDMEKETTLSKKRNLEGTNNLSSKSTSEIFFYVCPINKLC